MADTNYSSVAIDQRVRNGSRLILTEYIGASIVAAGVPSIGDGSTHPLSGFYASLAAAQVDYPFLTSTYHGVAWGSCELAAVALQAAIHDSKCAELYVPRGVYQLNIYIDIANRYLGGFRLHGAGMQSTSNTAYTAFVGNSGGVLFDLSGSEFIQLQDFAILPGSSTIGILQARTTDTPGFQSQYHHFRNLIVAMAHNPSANGGFGTFGIYNFASELGRYNNLVCIGDNPYFCSIRNPTLFNARRGDADGVYFRAQSPNSAVHVPGTISPLVQSFGSLGNLSFEGQCGFLSYMNPALTLNGCEGLHIPNAYFRNNTGVVAATSTTIASSISTGSHAVTPATMSPGGNAITVGQVLTVENSNGSNLEVVVVTALTSTTFTATFASSKTGPGIKVTYGDYTLAAINVIQGVTNVQISGTAEEFSKLVYTRTISFNFEMKVTLGVAIASVPLIDFDDVSGTTSTGFEGCSLRPFQGDFSVSTLALGGTPAVLIGEIWLGLTQGINLTTGGTGVDMTIFAQAWSPSISLTSGSSYELIGPGRRKIAAAEVNPTAQYNDIAQNGHIGVNNDLMVIAASNTTPIVITVEGAVHRLASAQQVTTFAIEGNASANGTLYAQTAGHGANQFALYSDSGLTSPVSGSGAYTAGGVVRASGRQSLVVFIDAATGTWYTGLNTDGSYILVDQVNSKTILHALGASMQLGATGVLVETVEDLKANRNLTVSGNTLLHGTQLGSLPIYVNNAAAVAGGLAPGTIYTVSASDPQLLAVVF